MVDAVQTAYIVKGLVNRMSEWTDMYKQKLTTPEQAVTLVKDGDWVDYGFGGGVPELAGRKDELHDIKLRETMSLLPAL